MSVKITTQTMKSVCDEATLTAERDDRRVLRQAGFTIPSIATLMLIVPLYIGAPVAGMVATLGFVDWARRTAQAHRVGGMRASCEVEGCTGFHRKDLQGWRGCSEDSTHQWTFGAMEYRPDITGFWEPKIAGLVGIGLNSKYRGAWWEKSFQSFGVFWRRATVVWRSGRGNCGHPVVWRISGYLAKNVARGLIAASRDPEFACIAEALEAEAKEYADMKPGKQVWRVVKFVDGYQPDRFGSMDCWVDASLAPAFAKAGLKIRDAPRFREE